jgi:8-oxo-dGTP pyrophosphatase MutT (NUDIX family)
MIQAASYRLLNCFMLEEMISFSELCDRVGYPTDLGGYYIRGLVSQGYLDKTGRGQYTITPKGKQQVARAVGVRPFAARPRFLVLLIVRRGDEYVVLRRSRQPFIGRAEWPAGAIELGEPTPEAATRILRERLGVAAVPVFRNFFRRTDFYGGEVFDDKLFTAYEVALPADAVLQPGEIGELECVTLEGLQTITRPARSLTDILKSELPYAERTYELTVDDLANL